MEKIGIIAKAHAPMAPTVVPRVVEWLKKRELKVVADPKTAALEPSEIEILPLEEVVRHVDLALILGGDGTLIAASRTAGDLNTPLLAVNLGSLGFLSVVTLPELEHALTRVLSGDFSVAERFLLDVELHPQGGEIRRYQVLNDAVVNKAALARIIRLTTSIDGKFLTTYQADGLIISTPTGSTAYSLSAGGPILYPSTEALVLSPICPHQLTNRSVVFPSRVRIEVLLETEREEVTLTLDGQLGVSLRQKDRIVVTRSENAVKLVTFPETDFFDVWRRKLHWGKRSE